MAEAPDTGALRIDARRLEDDLAALGRIGRSEDTGGLDRRAFSTADMAGRRWLEERLAEAGLDLRIDGAANLGSRCATSALKRGGASTCGSGPETSASATLATKS